MTRQSSTRTRLLRWYPEQWQHRYGQELLDLISDTYGAAKVPLQARLLVARAGLIERLRAVGFVGDVATSRELVRGGSLLMLCAWSFFIAGGSLFAKFSEHWEGSVSAQHRGVITFSFAVVQYAALCGLLIVVLAACIVLPTIARFISLHGWEPVRAALRRGLMAMLIVTGTTTAIIAWTHYSAVPPLDRSTWWLQAIGVTWGLLLLASLALGTSALVAVVSRLELAPQTSRMIGRLALAMAVVLSAIAFGALAWWINMIQFGQQFFASGAFGVSRGVTVVTATSAAMMLMGLSIAALGVRRVLRGLALR